MNVELVPFKRFSKRRTAMVSTYPSKGEISDVERFGYFVDVVEMESLRTDNKSQPDTSEENVEEHEETHEPEVRDNSGSKLACDVTHIYMNATYSTQAFSE